MNRATVGWVLAAGALLGCGRGAEVTGASATVRTATLTRGALQDRLLLTGDLRPGDSATLDVPRTEIGNLTIRWLAEDGAQVKAGEKVVEFDNSQFTTGLEQKRIAAAEADSALRSLRDLTALSLATKQHEVEQQRIALDKATLLASVPEDLMSQKSAHERKLEKTRAEVAVTKAERELVADRRAAELEIKVKQLDFEKARRAVEVAEKGIKELVLVAPRDGVVVVEDHAWESRRWQVGDAPWPGVALVNIPNANAAMLVRTELSDVDDGRVKVGMTGTCTLDAYPQEPQPCTVTELAPVATQRRHDSLRRGFAMTLSLAKSDQSRMRPGMSVKIELPSPRNTDAVLAPRGAVVFGEAPALRLPGGQRRPIKLGPCNAQHCAIEDGAKAGDVVEVAGT